MKCPYCEASMETGKTTVSKSGLGEVLDIVDMLTGGVSSMPHYVYFRGAESSETVFVDHARAAFYCPKCLALLIGPGEEIKKEEQALPSTAGAEEPNSPLCPACGAAVADQLRRCPSCDIVLR
jgi:hypothetical protein